MLTLYGPPPKIHKEKFFSVNFLINFYERMWYNNFFQKNFEIGAFWEIWTSSSHWEKDSHF